MEEQFYLCWPLVLLGLLRLDRAASLRILGYAYVGQAIARYLLSLTDVGWEKNYMTPFTHSTGLILGSALALAPLIKLPPKRTMNLLAIGALLYLVQISIIYQGGVPKSYPYLMPMAEWATVVLILSARSGAASWLSWKPLVRLGVYSYGVYLWHCLVIPTFVRLMGWQIGVWVGALASLLIAMISFHTVEAVFKVRRSDNKERYAGTSSTTIAAD